MTEQTESLPPSPGILRTSFAQDRREREEKIYDDYLLLMKVPGAMITVVEELLMKKYAIYSRSTVWNIRKRVEERRKSQDS